MKVLLDNDLAPLTFSWGFFERGLEAVGQALLEWRRSLFSQVKSVPVDLPIGQALRQLEPLTVPRRGELLLATQSGWTAYFDNGAKGGDPASSVGHLCTSLKCRGIAISCIPNTMVRSSKDARGVFGSVKFELFAPERTEFLNYERTIAVTNDGGRWTFSATGRVQDFERAERYQESRIVERFTAEMLEEYCSALGIRLFDPAFYGPRGLLLKINDPLPARAVPITLQQAREKLGFVSTGIN